MLLFKPFRNRFRFIVVCAAILGVAGVTIASVKKKDPLYTVIEGLEKKADHVLLDPDYKEGTLLNLIDGNRDRIVASDLSTFATLLDAFKKAKAAIEAEAEKRAQLDQSDSRIQSLAEIATRYLVQERRIYLNHFREAHQVTGLESSYGATLYDGYDLILPNNVGLFLVKDPQLGLRLNVWHVSRVGEYDHVELGLNPQDKNNAEEAVLKETATHDNYAKLVQLMSIRERTVNHWAIQRMSEPGALADPSLNSCGTNLVSFSRSKTRQGDYYAFLEKDDRYGEFQKEMKGGLAQATFHAPLLSGDEIASVYHQFLYSLPQFQDLVLGMIDPDQFQQYQGKIREIALSKVENEWEKEAKKAILLSSYPADLWSNDAVADRISWVAWEAQRAFLIQQMVDEAKNHQFSDYAESSTQVRQFAQKALDEVLTLKRKSEWRAQMKNHVVAYLASGDRSKVDLSERSDRFNSVFDATWPGIKAGSKALFVKHNADLTTRANISKEWDKDLEKRIGYIYSDVGRSELIRYHNAPSLTAFMSARLMKQRIYPWTPDQLSQFFYKKLAFMMEQKEFKGLSKDAQKIAKNRIVMKGMDRLFARVQQHYVAALKASKVDPADVAPGQDFLYRDLRQAVKEGYADFVKMIGTPPPAPKATPTPAPSKSVFQFRPMQVPVADNTRVVHQYRPELLKPQTDYLPPSKLPGVIKGPQDEAKDLFADAVAILGLAEPALNRFSGLVPQNRFLIENFLQMEQRVGHQTVKYSSQLPGMIIRSIYDQKLIADVIYGQILAQYPILTIQSQNKKDIPHLLDLMAAKGMAQGSVDAATAKAMLRNGVATAAKNEQSLVSEACRAQPFVKYDKPWRNVFQSAGTLRSLLQNSNPAYKKFDGEWMKLTRTWWQTQLEDVIDPVSQFFFYASLIAMAIAFAPVVIGGIAGLATVGSVSVGAAGIMETIGAGLAGTEASGAFASVAASVGKKIAIKAATKAISLVFITQVGVMGYVNCFQLPAQLRAQLGVANSQIGIFSQTTISRQEIDEASKLLFRKQVGTYIAGALILVPEGFFLVRRVKNVAGATVENALKRSATYEGNEAIVNGVREKTLKNLVEEHGTVKGTGKWVSQSARSIWKNGRITTVSAQAMREDLEKITTNKLVKLFPTPEAYEDLVSSKLYAINEDRQFLVKEIQAIRDTNPSSLTQFKNWIKNGMARYLVGGKYWKVAISERAKRMMAEDAMGTGVFQVRGANASEMREFFLRAYEEDLYQTQMYWVQKLTVLKTFTEDLSGEGKLIGDNSVIMQRFLNHFGNEDIARHEDLMNWVLLKTSGNAVNAKLRKWLGSTDEIREMKRIFQDHQTLMDELRKVSPEQFKAPSVPVDPNAQKLLTGPEGEATAGNAAENTAAVDASPGEEELVIVDTDPATGEVVWGVKPENQAPPKAARKAFKWWFSHLGLQF